MIGRRPESNRGLSHPKREFYHLTTAPPMISVCFFENNLNLFFLESNFDCFGCFYFFFLNQEKRKKQFFSLFDHLMPQINREMLHFRDKKVGLVLG